MHLLIIRHAESFNNRVDAHGGPATDKVRDPDLTADGRRQAEALSAAMIQPGRYPAISAVYASPTLRSVRTALPLASALGHRISLDHDLHEYVPGQGIADLCDTDSVSSLLGADPDQILPAPVGQACPLDDEREPAQARSRASRLLGRLRTHHAGDEGSVAVVTHLYFAQFLLASALGVVPANVWFRLQNTGSLALAFTENETVIDWINRTDHLPTAQGVRATSVNRGRAR